MRILVLTPIADEFAALVESLRERGFESRGIDLGRLVCESFADGELIVARGGLGKAQFGIQTQHAVDRLADRRLIVCAGTAGGLRADLAIGDVVAATETVEHDFRWGMASKPLPRFAGDSDAIDALRSAARDAERGFRVHFGAVASGDEGIADSVRARDLRAQTGALAVAWEGAGGARAAAFSGLPFLEIRGVSDAAGGDAPEEFEENLPRAMRNVASVIMDDMIDAPSSGGSPKTTWARQDASGKP